MARDALLTDVIGRQRAADALPTIASAGVESMPMEEIDAEVKAVRAGRRQREGGY